MRWATPPLSMASRRPAHAASKSSADGVGGCRFVVQLRRVGAQPAQLLAQRLDAGSGERLRKNALLEGLVVALERLLGGLDLALRHLELRAGRAKDDLGAVDVLEDLGQSRSLSATVISSSRRILLPR